jgi:ABC-type amino acid transport substrate-binding protein
MQTLRALLLLALLAGPASAGTVEDLRAAGVLNCGVGQLAKGFAEKAATGSWSGLYIDMCTALAAAVLGDDQRMVVHDLTGTAAAEALQAGDVDLVITPVSAALSLETQDGLLLGDALFYEKTEAGLQIHATLLRQDDAVWFVVVRWVRHVLVAADAASPLPDNLPSPPGLQPGWAQRVLAASGSYGDMFNRHFPETPRGLNAQWRDGGLLWAPPPAP